MPKRRTASAGPLIPTSFTIARSKKPTKLAKHEDHVVYYPLVNFVKVILVFDHSQNRRESLSGAFQRYAAAFVDQVSQHERPDGHHRR